MKLEDKLNEIEETFHYHDKDSKPTIEYKDEVSKRVRKGLRQTIKGLQDVRRVLRNRRLHPCAQEPVH